MTQAVIGLNSFNGGELDPRAEGRTDLGQYANSARRLLNMIPMVNGSATRRPGTQHAAVALHPTNMSRLITFRIGDSENYIIEMNAFQMRIFKDDGPLYYQSRTMRAAEYIPTSALFVFDGGHGFYHGQAVQFTTANNPDGAPTNLTLDTTYYVCLARGYLISTPYDNLSGAITTETSNITAGMGPYTVNGDNLDDVIWGGPIGGPWYTELPTGKVHHTSARFGPPSTRLQATSSFTTNLHAYPQEECMAKTLRLSTDPDDLHENITSFGGTWTLPSKISPVNTTEEIIIRHPYDKDQIWDLTFAQSFDRMYFYHGDLPPFQLDRWDVGAFRFIPVRFLETPYSEVSPLGKAVGVTTSTIFNEERGRVETHTTERAVFDAGHIGQSFIRPNNVNSNANNFDEALIGTLERLGTNPTVLTSGNGLPYQSFGALALSLTLPLPNNNLANGDIVCVVNKGNGLPSDLSENVAYYVINRLAGSGGSVQLALTAGGANIITTADGGADNIIIHLEFQAVTEQSVNTNHGYTDRAERIAIWANSEAPEGMTAGQLYRIRTIGAQTFYLEHYGGARDGQIVTVTSVGSGHLIFSHDGGSTVDDAECRMTVSCGGPSFIESKVDRWRVGELGPVKGWPSVGTLNEQRHIMCGSATYPNRIWLSQIGIELSFGPLELAVIESTSGTSAAKPQTIQPYAVLDTSAITIDPVTNSTSSILWAVGHNTLIIGTSTEVYEIFASSDRQTITPSNINSRIITSVGANSVPPIRAGADLFYMTRNGRQMQALLFDGLSAASAPVDLTGMASHVTDSEILQMAWQQEPYKVAWLARADGRLYGLTYDREQTVTGWHRHELGGSFGSDSFAHVQSVAVCPHDDPSSARGDYDRLWMSTFRTINGSQVQHIEFMTRGFETWSADQEAHHVDDAPAPFSGPSTVTPLTGMTWLEAETLEIFANGATLPSEVVASGTMTIDTASTYVVAGLGFETRYESLPLDAIVDDETTIQGLRKRIVDLFLRVHRSHAGSVGQDVTSLDSLGNLADGTNVPFTGLMKARAFHHEWSQEATIYLKITGPAPFHLNSMMARLDWSER